MRGQLVGAGSRDGSNLHLGAILLPPLSVYKFQSDLLPPGLTSEVFPSFHMRAKAAL